jgi:hypothetical protein
LAAHRIGFHVVGLACCICRMSSWVEIALLQCPRSRRINRARPRLPRARRGLPRTRPGGSYLRAGIAIRTERDSSCGTRA